MASEQKMKSLRKCHLFKRRRRRQHLFACFFGLILLFALIKLFYPIHSTIQSPVLTESQCHCSESALLTYPHGECFFDDLICYSGYAGHRCELALTNESYRAHCPRDSHQYIWNNESIVKLKTQCSQSLLAEKEWPRSCLFLCFYHRLTGVIQVPSIFWRKALKNELLYWQQYPTTIDDRLYEHVEGFHGYKTIPVTLKSIIEIGAGPFTQVQYLISPFRPFERITLVEPNALAYMELNNCAYRGGTLRGRPVTIIAESIETLMKKRRENLTTTEKYGAVMSMNVIEHVSDALEYFRGLYDLLEMNGLLIFHERWYDYPAQGDCVLENAENLHPIRITRWILDRFLAQFEPIFVNFNRTKRQLRTPCFEQGVYFIGRKTMRCQRSSQP